MDCLRCPFPVCDARYIYFIYLFILLSLLLAGKPVLCETVTADRNNSGSFLGRRLQVLEDTAGRFNFEEVRAGKYNADFKTVDDDTLNFGLTGSHFWLRIEFENPSMDRRSFLLEAEFPRIDSVDAWIPGENGEYQLSHAGQESSIFRRQFPYPNPVFSLNLKGLEKKTLYLRYHDMGTVPFPLRFWTAQDFMQNAMIKYIALAIMYGILLVMIFYNLFIFTGVRDPAYLLYSFHIACFLFFQINWNGLTQYLWPNMPLKWINWEEIASPGLMFISAQLFSISFLQAKILSPFIRKLSIGHAGASVLFTVCAAFLDIAFLTKIFFLPLTVFGIVVLLSMGIRSAMKGYRPARYFLFAWGMLLVGGLLYTLRAAGFLSSTIFTEYSFQIGSSLEVTLLSLALAYRINILVEEKSQLQSETLKQQLIANENLLKSNRLKDEFLANTSHELKTPLTGIIGLAEHLMHETSGKIGEQEFQNLRMIISSSRRLAALVNDILDFSKLKNSEISLRLQSVDPKKAAEYAAFMMKPLASKKNLSLILDFPDDLPCVTADEERLEQILLNLLSNAIKFTHTGSVTLRGRLEDGMVAVAVQDTGIGISLENQQHIFESFEQGDGTIAREFGGTGLGLSIVKKLAELHGSEIKVNSQPGIGSTFYFRLPSVETAASVPDAARVSWKDREKESRLEEIAAEISADEKKTADALSRDAGSEKNDLRYRILIVDDEPINLILLENLLRAAGYFVLTAEDAFEALAKLDDAKADLVLLDLMMPRMDGYEAALQIRAKFDRLSLPIIMLTAKNQLEAMIHGFESGVNDYVTKPFNRDELLSRIEMHLDLKHINAASRLFVPGEFLKMLNRKSIIDVHLGDQTRGSMTVLFADIRAYSALSEEMTPAENFNFLNGFLSRIGPAIGGRNGFISQYFGDGLMAVFSRAPDDAIEAAIDIQKTLRNYNNERISKNRTPVSVGIGLQYGDIMLGIIGDEHRYNGAVVADTVNLASRLEGLTKIYGAGIIISNDVLVRLQNPNLFHYRFLDKVRVVGRSQPAAIFEIFDGDPPDILLRKKTLRGKFEQALAVCLERDFSKAAEILAECRALAPNDEAVVVHLKRIEYYQKNGVPEDWQGVWEMTIK